jgi:hypothetical protein
LKSYYDGWTTHIFYQFGSSYIISSDTTHVLPDTSAWVASNEIPPILSWTFPFLIFILPIFHTPDFSSTLLNSFVIPFKLFLNSDAKHGSNGVWKRTDVVIDGCSTEEECI